MADLDTRDDRAVRNHVPLIAGYKAVAQQLQYVIAQASAWRSYQLPNPSTALASDADIREVVLRDATVRQADDIHRRATAGRTWAVVPQSEEWDEQWLAQIVERDLRNIRGFTEARYELAGAVLVGDAYAYIEYDEVRRWGSTWYVPTRLVDLDWRTIRYQPRDGIAVRQWSYEVDESGRLVPSSVFHDVPDDWPIVAIVYNDSASRLKRGRGLIDALAPSVWRKAGLFQSLLDAVEAHGSGYLIAAVDALRAGSNDAKTVEVSAWLEVLQRMRASHLLVHDKSDEMRIESPQPGGISAILEAIRYEDDQIRSLLLGSSLPFGGGSDGGGSLARSQEEKNTHESRIEYDRAKLDDDLSEQLIGWYLRMNARALREYGLPSGVVPPRFESGVGPRETFAELVEAAERMTSLGAPISLADLYERSPFSQPVDGDPTTEQQQPPQQASPWGGGLAARLGERFAGEYDESKHARDAEGKFAPKDAAPLTGREMGDMRLPALKEHAERIGAIAPREARNKRAWIKNISLRQGEMTADDWDALGVDVATERDDGAAEGDDPFDADDWTDSTVGEDAEAWHAAGFGPDDADEWAAAGFPPEQAATWVAAGFEAGETDEWFDVGVDDPVAARAYTDAGVSASDASDWITAGVTDAEAAREYDEAGMYAEDAVPWIAAGVSAEDATAWRKSFFDGADAVALHKAGISPKEADALYDAGFEDAEEAIARHQHVAADVAEWRAAGIDAADVAEWKAAGMTAEVAKQWEADGYAPEDAAPLHAAGFTPASYLAYSDAVDAYGIGPTAAAARSGVAPQALDLLAEVEYEGDAIDPATWDGDGISDLEAETLDEMGVSSEGATRMRAAGVSWDAISALHDAGEDVSLLVPQPGQFRMRRARADGTAAKSADNGDTEGEQS